MATMVELQYLFLATGVTEALKRGRSPQPKDKELFQKALEFFDLALRGCISNKLMAFFGPRVRLALQTHEYAVGAFGRVRRLEKENGEEVNFQLDEEHIFQFEWYRQMLLELTNGLPLVEGAEGGLTRFFQALHQEMEVQTYEPPDFRS